MRYLSNLLKQAYPSEFIRISEVFTSDEVFNLEVHYSIRVGNAVKEFNNFYELERCILKLVGEK